MERYETAHIEITQFDEDVITASVESCEFVCTSYPTDRWTVYYTDGTSETIPVAVGEKPEVCP